MLTAGSETRVTGVVDRVYGPAAKHPTRHRRLTMFTPKACPSQSSKTNLGTTFSEEEENRHAELDLLPGIYCRRD